MRSYKSILLAAVIACAATTGQAQTTPELPSKGKEGIQNNSGTDNAKSKIEAGESKAKENTSQDIQAPGQDVLESAEE